MGIGLLFSRIYEHQNMLEYSSIQAEWYWWSTIVIKSAMVNSYSYKLSYLTKPV